MNKQERVILLAKFTLLIDSTESLKPENKATQNWKKIAVYHISSMTLGIHTITCTTRYSLQSFFIQQMNEK